ncbi:MAG: protein jag [Ruminococcus sp.]|nr:protein jag [Ruminococcus sp.]
MTEIFTAKTVEEAKSLAAQKFGKSISDIKFEILEEGKKGGFLGLGAKDARVKATYESMLPPKAEASEAAKSVEKVAEPAAELVVEAVIAPAETPAAEVTAEAPAAEPAPAEEEEDFSLDSFTLIENESDYAPKVKIAKDYITSILRAMGIDAEFTVYQNETGAVINIESDNNGTIIGRRGETLDSIQYLCSIIANKGDKDYYRITIDCLGYRSKRKETLEQLANKVAKSVLRTGRSQPLEPMNPYERRVIHSAISKIEGVSSRSVGEEPYRKIIISSNNPRRGGGEGGGRRRDRRDDRRGGGRGNGRRRERREPFEPRAIDLSTSFEKDYKKPKPEDSMEGGLYGKIEL